MWLSMRKALAVGRKEFRQISRDRRSLLVLLFVPALFLLLYGYALNFDVQNVAASHKPQLGGQAGLSNSLFIPQQGMLSSGEVVTLVPDAAVSPTPRSHTRAVTSPGRSTSATWTFVRSAKRGCP